MRSQTPFSAMIAAVLGAVADFTKEGGFTVQGLFIPTKRLFALPSRRPYGTKQSV